MLQLKLTVTLLLFLSFSCAGWAQDNSEVNKTKKDVRKLEDIVVSEIKNELENKETGFAIKLNEEDLEKKQIIDTSDVLRYLPSIDARKYNVGGKSRVIIRGLGRGGRTITVSDGMSLTDLTSSYSDVMWNQIAPDEIENVEVIYGPFSALYPGNAIGGAVSITTKQPEEKFASIRTGYGFQNYKDYGYDETLPYYKANFQFGDRFKKFSFLGMMNVIDIDALPYSFSMKTVDSDTSGDGVPVTGWMQDDDPQTGNPRYIFGDQGTREEIEMLGKIKVGYDLDDVSTISAEFRHWRRNLDSNDPHTYLRDSNGNEVWSGKVEINGLVYSPTYYGCQEQEYEGNVYQIVYKRDPKEALKTQFVLGYVDNYKYKSRSSSNSYPIASHGGSGTLTDTDNGWYNVEWNASYNFSKSHDVKGGIHYDNYFIDSDTWTISDWKDEDSIQAYSKGSAGKTQTCAIYLQDDWTLTDKWSIYFGGRYEWWKSYDGSISGIDSESNKITENIDSRNEDYFSPKFAVTYQPFDKWSFRLSLAQAYKFPTTYELFYGSMDSSTGMAIKTNPDLKVEKTFAKDFTIKRIISNGEIRLSVFENDIDDYIWRQSNIYTNTSYYQNIEQVRIRGVELDVRKKIGKYLDPGFNITYMDPKIVKNSGYPDSEGKLIPRVAEWTGNAYVNFTTPIENLSGLVAAKYSSYPYRQMDNSDLRNDGFGTDEGYLIFDAKLSYGFLNHWTASLSVDNITDELVHRYHPFSGRMFSLEIKWEY
ncbi:TonB-dependent receptor [Desulfosarcina ovata]|uniref:TonB-dependent receptor n=1 Tax=Desulfosarcina ovata subsp. ovata TaxID=2752305 RepID=A0A5K8AAW7_9BACT|nr:TonB-dependent receptor [Desulfosarcina ovata]BBO89184.1 TonB-dependent receptor [Desulfosarcina ovata subsp. ovata]